MLNIIFFGTPDIGLKSLEYLYNSPNFNVMAVVTQPDRPSGRGHKLTPSPIKVFALENNIPVYPNMLYIKYIIISNSHSWATKFPPQYENGSASGKPFDKIHSPAFKCQYVSESKGFIKVMKNRKKKIANKAYLLFIRFLILFTNCPHLS